MTVKVAPTQADREAAAAMWDATMKGAKHWGDWPAKWVRDGTADNGPIVQAFAAHRAASAEPLRCALEEITEAYYDDLGEKAMFRIARTALGLSPVIGGLGES